MKNREFRKKTRVEHRFGNREETSNPSNSADSGSAPWYPLITSVNQFVVFAILLHTTIFGIKHDFHPFESRSHQ